MIRIFHTIIAVTSLAASLVAQQLPAFELTKEWEAKIEAMAPERPLAEPKKKEVGASFQFDHWLQSLVDAAHDGSRENHGQEERCLRRGGERRYCSFREGKSLEV